MGAWAVDAFGNDDAVDWSYGLEGAEDLSLIQEALDAVTKVGAGYLEAPEASSALAAIEAIARLQGHGGVRNSYTKGLDAWVDQVKLPVPPVMVTQAHAVIQRIVGDQSELKELWQESDQFDAWIAAVNDLKSRVRA
jgi:Domain of unknown function (DUF4259)